MWMYLIAVIGYLTVLAAAGIWWSRRATTGDDFLVAGRSLPAHILVFTLLSTWIGSGSLFAGAGLGYRIGWPALWQSAGAWLGIAIIFFIAPRVRRIAQYTVPDVLEMRYGPPAACSARSRSCSRTRRLPPISFAAAAGCCIWWPDSIR